MVMGTLWTFSVRRCAVTTISSRPPALAEEVASAALACGPKAVAAPAVPSTARTARRMVSLEFKWISPILVEFSFGGMASRQPQSPGVLPLRPTLRDLWRGINAVLRQYRKRRRRARPRDQSKACSLKEYCAGTRRARMAPLLGRNPIRPG